MKIKEVDTLTEIGTDLAMGPLRQNGVDSVDFRPARA
jgi:hypothetical protein